MLVLTSGCVPLPVASLFYKYEIEVSASGRHYSYSQYLQCSRYSVVSALDGQFHNQWDQSGAGSAVIDIGNDLILVFGVGVNCGQADEERKNNSAWVLATASNPNLLYSIQNELKELSVVIQRVSVKRVERPDAEIGLTKNTAVLKQKIRERQHGFQRLTVTAIPYEVWATSDASRAYFSQFKSVAVAKVGEAPPVSGYAENEVRFPFYRERQYQKNSKGTVSVDRVAIPYNGDAFELTDRSSSKGEVWYSTKENKSTELHWLSSPSLVSYKGTTVRVKMFQEIYDPETKNIFTLSNGHRSYPWDNSDADDNNWVQGIIKRRDAAAKNARP